MPPLPAGEGQVAWKAITMRSPGVPVDVEWVRLNTKKMTPDEAGEHEPEIKGWTSLYADGVLARMLACKWMGG
jgi:hypothetical protein